MLTGLDRLYIMQEPDAGGTAFVTQIARKLEAWQWPGKAFVLRLEGVKDPNELHQHDRQGFRTAFQHVLDQAEPLSSRSSQSALSPSQQGQPSIFSLPDLLSWELPPVRWAIPEILPEGLTLLAGKPKLGKSWLALSVALSIAAGGVALGAQPVAKGHVLYLALAMTCQAPARIYDGDPKQPGVCSGLAAFRRGRVSLSGGVFQGASRSAAGGHRYLGQGCTPIRRAPLLAVHRGL